MAALDSAVARIHTVFGMSAIRHASPATISGNSREVYSYALRIAYKDGDDWLVRADEDNSQTTNRHIRAAKVVIGGDRFRRAWDGCATETIDGVRWVRCPKDVA